MISVVIVNYERRELLRACLASLERQQQVMFEVVLVDNGSRDGSVEMAEQEFAVTGRLRLQVVRNSANQGFCRANNQGFAAASGELIALLNNDAEAEPGWLAALASAFAGRPEVGMAASKILVYDEPRKIDKVGHLIYLDGQNRGRGTGQWDQGQYDEVEEVLWPDGCAAMYRRSLLTQVGGFDEDFFAYADDADLGLRARIAGWQCLYVPTAVVRHHRGKTLGVRSVRRLELIERNRVLLAAKLFPGSLLWLNGMYYLLRIGAGLWAAARRRGEVSQFPGWQGKLRVITALARGDWQALTMLPQTWRKRRAVDAYRQLSPRQVRALLERHRISLREISEQAT